MLLSISCLIAFPSSGQDCPSTAQILKEVKAGTSGAGYYERHVDEPGLPGIFVRARLVHRLVAADGRSVHAEEPLVEVLLAQKTRGADKPSLEKISLCDNEGHQFKLTLHSERQDDTQTLAIYATDIKQIRDHLRFNDPSYHLTLSVLFWSDGKQYAWVAREIQPAYQSEDDLLPPPHDTPVGALVQLAVFILLPLGLLIGVVWGIRFFLAKREV